MKWFKLDIKNGAAAIGISADGNYHRRLRVPKSDGGDHGWAPGMGHGRGGPTVYKWMSVGLVDDDSYLLDLAFMLCKNIVFATYAIARLNLANEIEAGPSLIDYEDICPDSLQPIMDYVNENFIFGVVE